MNETQNNAPVDGIAILLWSADPSAPHRLATPFFCAAAAAAMDTPVEVFFAARSVELLRPGVAAELRASAHPKTILDSMHEAIEHGAVFYACRDALVANDVDPANLIEECKAFGGAVQFMARMADPTWRTMVF
jgi:hypothetical protein